MPALAPTTTTSTAPRLKHTGVACAHCGLPVPAGLIERSTDGELSGEQFCCHGCKTARELISSCGLDGYYRLLNSGGDRAPEMSPAAGLAYAEMDTPAYAALYCRPAPGSLVYTEFLLDTAHCAACVWLVEKLGRVVPGVTSARLDLSRSLVHVVFDPQRVSLSTIARSLATLGYPPRPPRSGSGTGESERRAEDRRQLVRIGVAGACAGNIMLLFIALYAGMFQGMDAAHVALLRWSSTIISAVCILWPGWVFIRSALTAIRLRAMHIDIPIALGLVLGLGWGLYNTIVGTGEIYFDSISAFVFFLLVGRFVQHRRQRAAAESIEALFSRTASNARVVRADGRVEVVPVEGVSVGDEVEVLSEQSAPVDAVLLSELGRFDQSVLTGESRAVHVALGESVPAGSVNVGGPVRLRATATGENTRIARLMRTVAEAAARRGRTAQLADIWAARLLAGLLVLALITLAVWWPTSPHNAVQNAIALLVVVCPCGLGLAMPLCTTVALGRAARRGMLIKGADALEHLASARRPVVFLDKTGTITAGRLSLVRFAGDRSLAGPAARAEETTNHPIARALARDLVCEHASRMDSAGETAAEWSVRVPNVRTEPSRGLFASFKPTPAAPALELVIGTRALVESKGVSIPASLIDQALAGEREALTPVFIAACLATESAQPRVALALLGDPIADDARASVDALKARGFRVGMLSGDRPGVAAAVASRLGLDDDLVHAGLLPEDKASLVEAWKTRGPVIMVGDGVNDASALAHATVGIAVHAGAEASLAAADIALTRPGLGPIVELVDGSRRLMNTVRLTIAVSLAYNAVAAALCVAGQISPLAAAIIMPASSLSVLALALRTRAFRIASLRTGRTPANPTGSLA